MSSAPRQSRKKGVFMKGQLKLSAYMNHGLVTVHVMQGRHLCAARQAHPDSFVMISIIPEEEGVTPTRCRTGVARGTSCPTYNEKFSFEVSEEDVYRRLLLTVWSKDSNSGVVESFGCTSFGICHLGNRPVSGWYHLLTDSVGVQKHLKVAMKDRPAVPVMQSREPQIAAYAQQTSTHIPAVNQDIHGSDRHELCISRSLYGGFGFTVIGSCPVKIGRVDGASQAEKSGLLAGDLVIRVNGQNVSRSTSVSVAKCIKRSADMVRLEVHRPYHLTPPTPVHFSAHFTKGDHSDCDDDLSAAQSVQDFTIYNDQTALLEPSIGIDTRRQAAVHRLLCMEENYVEVMTSGIQKFSRPLRHCIASSTEHAALFQNIEKLVCMSQYLVKQIVDNLPNNSFSDDDTDTSMCADADLTSVVAMIYRSKLPVLCQAYMMYISGLHRASQVLSALETRADFRHFLLGENGQGRQLSLCDFINRPLQHVRDLGGILTAILATTAPETADHRAYTSIVTVIGKQSPNGNGKTSEGTSMLSQQLFKAAFGESPHQETNRTVIPFAGFGGSRERINSGSSDKSDRSGSYVRRATSTEASTPPAMFAQSPSNMEGPIAFVAPELSEETLMDDNHNATLAKLNFALDLVECILEVARSRGAPLNSFSESVSVNKGEQLPDQQQVPRFTEAQRRLEQLILHVRGLHLLSSALQLAWDEIKSGKLTISNSVKTVVKQMNEHYHVCVTVSRQLQKRLESAVQSALSPQIVIATADKLIYNYAIEMCQTAALDELFGNPHECFKRYQTAQILLHSLAQQSRNTRDR